MEGPHTMTQYTDMQLDALRELANIGSGTASTALSAMLGRSVEQEVLSVSMPVVDATDLLVGKLAALNEHACDLSKVLPTARALREKIDWERAADETAWNDIAVACLFLLRRIGVAPDGLRPRE